MIEVDDGVISYIAYKAMYRLAEGIRLVCIRLNLEQF